MFESKCINIIVDTGGEGGIRTHDPGFAGILLFESRAFSRSATSPGALALNAYNVVIHSPVSREQTTSVLFLYFLLAR